MQNENLNSPPSKQDLSTLAKLNQNKQGNGQEHTFSKSKSDFSDKASILAQDVQDLGKITKDLAGVAFQTLGGNASGFYDKGIKKAKSLEMQASSQIREKPMRYVLIAAGIGLLAGVLWKRR